MDLVAGSRELARMGFCLNTAFYGTWEPANPTAHISTAFQKPEPCSSRSPCAYEAMKFLEGGLLLFRPLQGLPPFSVGG